MGLLPRLFTKSRKQSLFSFFFPEQAPSVFSRNELKAYAGWVHACVRVISNQVATAEIVLQEKTTDGWKNIDSHPATDLLVYVNPWMTSDDHYYSTQAFSELVGNAFWYVARNRGGTPAELWQLNPTRVSIIKDEKNYIGGYVYTNDKGNKVKLAPNEVIHFHDFNPEDPYVGLGTVRPAALPIDIDTYASRWNRNFFNSSAMPGFLLTTEQNITDEQYARLEQQWLEKHQGVINAHKPDILEGGLKAQVLTQSAREMDYTEGKKEVRDEILAIFGVPKPILGITEDVNRANAEASEYVFAKYTIAPKVMMRNTRLTEFYLPMWNLDPAKYRIWSPNLIPQNVELETKVKQISLASGWATRNEIRKAEGLKPVDGGDTILVPNNYVPLDLALNPPPPVAPSGQPPADKPKPKKPAKEAKGYSASDDRSSYFTHTINAAQNQVQELFLQQQAFVAKKLKDGKAFTKDEAPHATEAQEAELLHQLFDEWGKWVAPLALLIGGFSGEVLAYAGARTILAAGIDATFDPTNPRAVQWLKDRGLLSATEVNDHIKDELRKRLVQGIKDGKSVSDIANDLSSFYDEQGSWRALRLARTEVMTAYAQGSLEAARQTNLQQKRWLSVADQPEEECAQNTAAGWLDREATFPSGHMAPTAHPNCRCELEWRMKPEDEA